jgi:threonine/homoserine/homoserine lactone efflux protein
MLEAIVEGVIYGTILSFLIGPIFFLLVQTSMREGIRQSLFLIAGIFASDVFCIVLAYFGVSEIFKKEAVKEFIGLAGGAIMIVFGAVALFHKPKIHLHDVSTYVKTKPVLLLVKGFILNTTNPFVFLFWLGTMGAAMNTFKSSSMLIFTHFTSVMITVFCFDLMKSFSANKLGEKINPKAFRMITRISGAAIIVFGFVLIYRAFWT